MVENRPVRLVVVGLAVVASATLAASAAAGDWLQFGFDSARSNAPVGSTGITAANVGSLVRQQVKLDGVADSSAAYLHDVKVNGATHDTFFVTTSYGRTYAIDADSGAILWQFVPPGIGSFEHSAQITESSPLVDPDRTSIYTASPDGKIHRLAVSDGSETTTGNWPAAVTLDAKHEKIASALNLSGNLVLVAVGSYFGFAPYQGHVVALDRRTGRIVHVFNASCSNRSGLLDPTTCPVSGPGMWARAGVVVEPGSGRLLVATANGLWNGRNAWADSVLELSPDAGKLIQSYTPANQSHLGLDDLDLGSTAPAILTAHVALQGGKDGKLRLLDLDRLNGKTRAPGKLGGELQLLSAPRGREVLTAPAVWHSGGRVWAFVATFSAIAAYRLVAGPKPRLQRAWETGIGGSSPIVAGGLLYVYSPLTGSLNVFNPTSGKRIAQLDAGLGHWNSPIVADGRIALPEGDANRHSSTSVLDIYRLPGR
jgi:outer membrane protein assembly factor BamB